MHTTVFYMLLWGLFFYYFTSLFSSSDSKVIMKKTTRNTKTLVIIFLFQHNLMFEIGEQSLYSAYLPLDAPGGASYIKLRPFLTRSSPINNLEVGNQYF